MNDLLRELADIRERLNGAGPDHIVATKMLIDIIVSLAAKVEAVEKKIEACATSSPVAIDSVRGRE